MVKVRNMALCGLFAAGLCIGGWLSVPVGDIALSMQTFGVFLTLGVLGGKRGTAAIAVYLAMGAVGLPVFTGFRGGLGVLMGTTGGYLWGFLFSALVYWTITALAPKAGLFAMALGLLVCYACGTAWYCIGYLQSGVWAVLLKCVMPYIIPDCIKLFLAYGLAKRINIPSGT